MFEDLNLDKEKDGYKVSKIVSCGDKNIMHWKLLKAKIEDLT